MWEVTQRPGDLVFVPSNAPHAVHNDEDTVGDLHELRRRVERGAFYTLVPIRPRWRGERRSLRTFAVVSLRPPLAFNPRPRRLSTPLLTPLNSTPTFVRLGVPARRRERGGVGATLKTSTSRRTTSGCRGRKGDVTFGEWKSSEEGVGGEGEDVPRGEGAARGGETASHTTPFAWCTPFLEDFSRRHSSPALPFQRLTGKTFD